MNSKVYSYQLFKNLWFKKKLNSAVNVILKYYLNSVYSRKKKGSLLVIKTDYVEERKKKSAVSTENVLFHNNFF